MAETRYGEPRGGWSDPERRASERDFGWRDDESERAAERGQGRYAGDYAGAGSERWGRGPESDFGGGPYSDRERERSYGRIGRGGTDELYRGRGRSDYDPESERGYGPSRGGGIWRQSAGGREHARMGGYGREFERFGPVRTHRGREDVGIGGFGHEEIRDEERFGREHGYGGFQGDYGGGRGQGGFGGRGDWEGGRVSLSPERYSGAREEEPETLGYEEFRGTLGGFGNQTVGIAQDEFYRSWRDRQLQELDRDFEEYRREREQQFHQDFDEWRRNREARAAETTGRGTTTGRVAGTTSGTAGGNVTGTVGTPGAGRGRSTRGSPTSGGTATGAAGVETGAATGTETGETEKPGSGGGRSGGSRS